jgi:hypothetical protein
MSKLVYILTTFLVLVSIVTITTSALPVVFFDADIAANPFVHDKRLNYRGGRLVNLVK